MKSREELIEFCMGQGSTRKEAEKRADHIINEVVPDVMKYIEENYIEEVTP